MLSITGLHGPSEAGRGSARALAGAAEVHGAAVDAGAAAGITQGVGGMGLATRRRFHSLLTGLSSGSLS